MWERRALAEVRPAPRMLIYETTRHGKKSPPSRRIPAAQRVSWNLWSTAPWCSWKGTRSDDKTIYVVLPEPILAREPVLRCRTVGIVGGPDGAGGCAMPRMPHVVDQPAVPIVPLPRTTDRPPIVTPERSPQFLSCFSLRSNPYRVLHDQKPQGTRDHALDIRPRGLVVSSGSGKSLTLSSRRPRRDRQEQDCQSGPKCGAGHRSFPAPAGDGGAVVAGRGWAS